MNILVVDDDPMAFGSIKRSVGQIARQAGQSFTWHKALSFDDARQAVTDNGPFDAIIVDGLYGAGVKLIADLRGPLGHTGKIIIHTDTPSLIPRMQAADTTGQATVVQTKADMADIYAQLVA